MDKIRAESRGVFGSLSFQKLRQLLRQGMKIAFFIFLFDNEEGKDIFTNPKDFRKLSK
jgi:hypothetical protein